MKIAILGTRGIPNNYGGFEQLAQYLSLGLAKRGHEVYVYSSHRHPYQEKTWNGVHVVHRFDPEKTIGTAGQFVYDLASVLDARKRKFDVILNLGYTSSAFFLRWLPRSSKVVTNMDGLEWKRTKYSRPVRRFLEYSESLAIKRSDRLIADSTAIRDYLQTKYGVASQFIAYGAEPFRNSDPSVVSDFGLEPGAYNMLIARMEPENNLEMILEGVSKSSATQKMVVVGNPGNKYGQYLRRKFKGDSRIVFAGPIYDDKVINNLRFFSNLYFHGHSVGGTNPSLLEAMGCSALIAAHDNVFNRAVLQHDAHYFSSSQEVSRLVETTDLRESSAGMIERNFERIEHEYSWANIIKDYEEIMTSTDEN